MNKRQPAVKPPPTPIPSCGEGTCSGCGHRYTAWRYTQYACAACEVEYPGLRDRLDPMGMMPTTFWKWLARTFGWFGGHGKPQR
jgi:hypothetical protein